MRYSIYDYGIDPPSASVSANQKCELKLCKHGCIRGIVIATPLVILMWALIVLVVNWLT